MNSQLTYNQIQFLYHVCGLNWTETNGTINVNGEVNMSHNNLTQISVKFNNISREFRCNSNLLTNLKNGPNEVNSDYICSFNQLTSLFGAPYKCKGSFLCINNKLKSLEGCPSIIDNSFWCTYNPDLYILYGIRQVKGKVHYDHVNDLNEWIIQQARKNIFVSYTDIAKWIKCNTKYEFLLHAPQEIRQHFSKYIINTVELNLC